MSYLLTNVFSYTLVFLVLFLHITIVGNDNLNTEIIFFKNKPIVKKLPIDQSLNKINDRAFTLCAEDRSNTKGMKYILSVILNRSKNHKLNTMHKIVLAKYQFSCWHKGKKVRQTNKNIDKKMYAKAITLVKLAINGKFKPLTTATHYYNPNKVIAKWDNGSFKEVAIINDHKFLVAVN